MSRRIRLINFHNWNILCAQLKINTKKCCRYWEFGEHEIARWSHQSKLNRHCCKLAMGVGNVRALFVTTFRASVSFILEWHTKMFASSMENKKKSYEENTKVLSEALFVLHSLTMRVFPTIDSQAFYHSWIDNVISIINCRGFSSLLGGSAFRINTGATKHKLWLFSRFVCFQKSPNEINFAS